MHGSHCEDPPALGDHQDARRIRMNRPHRPHRRCLQAQSSWAQGRTALQPRCMLVKGRVLWLRESGDSAGVACPSRSTPGPLLLHARLLLALLPCVQPGLWEESCPEDGGGKSGPPPRPLRGSTFLHCPPSLLQCTVRRDRTASGPLKTQTRALPYLH